MGKTQSKEMKEEIIIAQNGGASNSATSATSNSTRNETLEVYILILLILVLTIIGYFAWRRCKYNYGRFIRRELQELPMATMVSQGQNGCANQQVIV